MIALAVVIALAGADVAPRPAELVLERALPLDGLASAEPSGLALRDGELFTVSDNHDSFIYHIRVEAERGVLEPAIPVAMPGGGRGDFEGIVVGDKGDFYVASEVQFRILHVSRDGKECTWVTPSLRAAGEAAGLFKFRGGYIEGLARVDATHLVVCGERQPRGVMYVDISADPPVTEGFVLNDPTIQPRGLRFPDITDLCLYDGTMYVLERNAEIISIIERKGKRHGVIAWRSYRDTLERKEYRYGDRRFGTAEGLAMDEAHIYIVLDNNGTPREANPADTRPILFTFKRPRP